MNALCEFLFGLLLIAAFLTGVWFLELWREVRKQKGRAQ